MSRLSPGRRPLCGLLCGLTLGENSPYSVKAPGWRRARKRPGLARRLRRRRPGPSFSQSSGSVVVVEMAVGVQFIGVRILAANLALLTCHDPFFRLLVVVTRPPV